LFALGLLFLVHRLEPTPSSVVLLSEWFCMFFGKLCLCYQVSSCWVCVCSPFSSLFVNDEVDPF